MAKKMLYQQIMEAKEHGVKQNIVMVGTMNTRIARSVKVDSIYVMLLTV